MPTWSYTEEGGDVFMEIPTVIHVRLAILTCNRCPLSEKVRAPVPFQNMSDGIPPRFVVVGEAPGRMEDYSNTPFYGPAGKLLRKRLRVVGLHPEHGMFMNAACCWPQPSGIKAPDRTHLDACAIHLKAQLDLYPGVPVLLCGGTALKAILPGADLKYALGREFHLYGREFFTVWHPSYIQRNWNLLSTWTQNLTRFRELVDWGDGYEHHPLCIYCTTPHEHDKQTCRKHRARWERDRRWPTYKAQGSLFG